VGSGVTGTTGSAAGAGGSTGTTALAFTGSNIAAMAFVALMIILFGGFAVLLSTRATKRIRQNPKL
jgi:hypothetical protein